MPLGPSPIPTRPTESSVEGQIQAQFATVPAMTPMKWLAAVIGVLGLLALIGGILYFTIPAHSLPSFLGPLPRVNAHRKRRGEAAIAVAVVLWVVAAIVIFVGRRQAAGASAAGASGSPASASPAAPGGTPTSAGTETP